MIEVFYHATDSNVRKLKVDLKKQQQNITYVKINNLNEKQIKRIFAHAEDINQILSTRCKVMKENKDLFSLDIKFSQLIKLILRFPSLLKSPIILDEQHNRFSVGYNKDDVELFLR